MLHHHSSSVRPCAIHHRCSSAALQRVAPIWIGRRSRILIADASAADEAADGPSTSGQQQEQTAEQQQQQQPRAAEAVRARAAARRREQVTYRAAAVAASLGVSALAAGATYLRFSWLRAAAGAGAPLPWLDMAATLLLVAGGAIGMEAWARFAHRALWHDFQPGWALHKSHHEPRAGPFEANDIFAVMNAVPAMALCAYGFLTPTLAGSLCFGAGLGITLFGISYMFMRFPVGPIARLPAMRRVVAAHKLHHTDRYGGVPFGLFLGPQELEAIGAGGDLDRLVAEMEAAERGGGGNGGGGGGGGSVATA